MNYFQITRIPLIIDTILGYNHYFLQINIIQKDNKTKNIISKESGQYHGWVSYLVNRNTDGQLYVQDSFGNNSTVNTELNLINKLMILGSEYFINCDKNGKKKFE